MRPSTEAEKCGEKDRGGNYLVFQSRPRGGGGCASKGRKEAQKFTKMRRGKGYLI